MKSEHIGDWILAVEEHTMMVAQIVEDRKVLKREMENYLSKFFEWDFIEYSSDFKTITLKWKWHTDPVIKYDNLCDLKLDWRMKSFSEEGCSYIAIEICPCGFEEESQE